jgi:hypothetical protein
MASRICKVGFRTFCQPMCKGCQDYCLDYSSIFADLHYIIHEAAVEKKSGTEFATAAGQESSRRLHGATASQEAQLTDAELVALRFYTSHSFNALNIAMRDQGRNGPTPCPAS